MSADDHLETVFFGGWEISALGPVDSLSQWSLQVSGSIDDGTFQLTDGDPVTWPFSGSRWTLTVLAWFQFPTAAFYPTPSRVSKHYEAGVGLVVDLEAHSGSDLVGPPLHLRCVNSADYPVPVASGPPFDFEIPER